eukprot:1193449-Prorocentrum_minimum.AAC.1
MKRAGVRATIVTHNALIAAAARGGHWAEALAAFEEMQGCVLRSPPTRKAQQRAMVRIEARASLSAHVIRKLYDYESCPCRVAVPSGCSAVGTHLEGW